MQSQYADLPTDDYQPRNGRWYWRQHECKGADDSTFKPCNNVWAIDGKGLFKHNTRARIKDPATCQVLNLLFAKDSQQVYYIEGVAKAVADVAGFEVLDSGRYITACGSEAFFGFARDSQNVYAHEFFSGAPTVLKGADRDSFCRLEYGFGKDAKRVWHEKYRIKKADPHTFEVIDNLYSKDARRAYYDDTPLADADPATFRVIGPTTSRIGRTTACDAAHVYFQRDLIEGASPETFRVDEDDPWVGRDGEYVYHGQQRVAGADPATFRPIGESYYFRDRHTIYYHGRAIEGVDPATFELVGHSRSTAKDKYRTYESGKVVTR